MTDIKCMTNQDRRLYTFYDSLFIVFVTMVFLLLTTFMESVKTRKD